MATTFGFFSLLMLAFCGHPVICNVYKKALENVFCEEMPASGLEHLLGAAFNPRYMSIDTPAPEETSPSLKRKTSTSVGDFYVDDNFLEEIGPSAAWEIDNHVGYSRMLHEMPHGRYKRDVNDSRVVKRGVDYMKQWQCPSKITWSDLGSDYFPRYLRMVECPKKNCWFEVFHCKPKSFTVKVLKRKKGICVVVDKDVKKIGNTGLPYELREKWVWEERAVTFCCDCTRTIA